MSRRKSGQNTNKYARLKLNKLSLPKGQTLREYIKAKVKADPLVVQDRRVLWEKFYKHLPR